MSAYYTFQLSRMHCIEPRSNGPDDINLITFGVLLNKREQGRGAAVIPVFRGSTIGGREITDYSANSGYGATRSRVNMRKDWLIGPTEVRDEDGVEVVLTSTNTNDSDLPTADQQKIDRLIIDAMNIYYSWLLGQFVSGLGLKAIAGYFQTAKDATGAAAAFFADPVGTVLGYEPKGPCNGPVFTAAIGFSARDLHDLDWSQEDPGRNHGVAVDSATLTRTYDDADTHNTERCGPVARTEIDVTIRRWPYWAVQDAVWDGTGQRVTSVKQRYPGVTSLKAAAGIRL